MFHWRNERIDQESLRLSVELWTRVAALLFAWAVTSRTSNTHEVR